MTPRILVVDDEPDVRECLLELLRTLPDVSVEAASSFAEGRAKAAAGGWEMVISDERLPDGRGVALLAEAARADPRATRVLMSAFRDADILIRAVNDAGIDRFVQKPWEPQDMLAWVEAALRRGGP